MKDHERITRRVVHHVAYPRTGAGGAAPPMIEHFCIPTSAELTSDVAWHRPGPPGAVKRPQRSP